MKRGPLLNPALSHLLASTGHTDYFTVCDRGFPVPIGPERIDLALTDDIPTVLDVLKLIHAEFHIDRVVIPAEVQDVAPHRVAELKAILGNVPLYPVPHVEFKRLSHSARATVRTGDTTLYGNIIVVSG
jgi:D-ribose pyranase